MARRWYSKKHYEMVSPKPDTDEDIKDRELVKTAAKLSAKDTAKKYPVMDINKAGEILDYQQSRFKYHINQLRADN